PELSLFCSTYGPLPTPKLYKKNCQGAKKRGRRLGTGATAAATVPDDPDDTSPDPPPDLH
ncbi:hypothetical protein V502_00479, partial [Pseudogymnoascus sp. VKM F-4520 (FW-2644)]